MDICYYSLLILARKSKSKIAAIFNENKDVQSISENISNLWFYKNIMNCNIFLLHPLSYKMVVYNQVLYLKIKHCIWTKAQCKNIITMQRERIWQELMLIIYKWSNPTYICSTVSQCLVFSFNGASWNRGLFLWLPRDWIITNIHNITCKDFLVLIFATQSASKNVEIWISDVGV